MTFEDRSRKGTPYPERVSSGRLVNRSAALQARREEFAARASTVYDWASLCTAPTVQLRAFDDSVGDLHDAVGVANHELYGDPHPVVFYGPTLQRRARDDERVAARQAHAVAAEGLSGAATTLPHLDTIQRAFGEHDVTHVQAHVDGRAQAAAQQLHAHGYASGDAVAFASQPDLFTAAHEAAHIVQQRAGVALSDGFGRAGDVYERHADEVAALVVRGQSAEGALSRMVGAGRGASPSAAVQLDSQSESKGGGFMQWFADAFGRHEEASTKPEWVEPALPMFIRAPHKRIAENGRVEEAQTYVGGREAIVDVDHDGATTNRYRSVQGTQVLDQNADGKVTTGTERYEQSAKGLETTTNKREVDGRSDVATQSFQLEQRDRVETAKRAQTQLIGRRDALEFQANELKGRASQDAASKARLVELESERRRVETLIKRLDDPDQLEHVAEAAEALPNPQRFEWENRTQSTTHTRGTDSKYGRTETFDERKFETQSADTTTTNSDRSTSFHGVDQEKLGYASGKTREVSRTKTVSDPDGDGFDRVENETEHAAAQHGWNLLEGGHTGVSRGHSLARADGSGASSSDAAGWSAGEGLYQKSSTSERDALGHVRERSTQATADRNTVAGKVEGVRGKEGDHWAAKGRGSADGSFSVVVKPVGESAEAPAHYEIVTTIKVAGGLGADGDVSAQRKDGRSYRDNDARGSVSGGASVSATYTHTRVLSVDEAKAYLAEVDRVEATGKSGSLPEFDTWAKVKAWAKQDGSLQGVAGAFGSGKTARDMKTGDSVSFELEGRGEGGAKAGLGVVDGGVSVQGGVKRVVTVKRLQGDLVEVGVELASDSEWGAHGGGKLGIVGGKVGGKQGTSSGRAVTFHLDSGAPGYDAKFARIGKAISLEELEALRRAFAKEVVADKRSKGEHEDMSGNVSIGTDNANVSFSVGDGTFADEAVDTKGPSTFTGGSQAGAHVGAQTPVGKVSVGTHTKESGVAEVDEAGDLTVQIAEQVTSSGLSANNARREGAALGDAIRGPRPKAPSSAHDVVRGAEKTYDSVEAARAKVAKGAELLTESDTRLRSIGLTQADVTALTARAKSSEAEWQNHAVWSGPAAFNAWLALRGQLLRPTAQADEVQDAGPHKAEQFARARAVQTFVQSAGGKGRIIMESALRNWGVGAFGGGTRHAELGHAQAFPKSISILGDKAGQKGEWSTWFDDVSKFGATLEALAKTPDGMAKAQALVTRLSDRGDALRQAIESAGDFEEPRVRAEMLTRLSTANEKRRAQYQAFLVESGVAAGKSVDTKVFSEQNSRRRVSELVGILVGLKQDERRLLESVETELSEWVVDWNGALTTLGRVQTSYEFWVARVRELRALYAQSGAPPASWRVSAGPGKPRRDDTEPDVNRLYRIMKDEVRDVEALKRIEALRTKCLTY